MSYHGQKTVIGLWATLVGLAGCATPYYAAKTVNPDLIIPLQAELQKEAIAQKLGRWERLVQLTWPLLAENAGLCRKTRPDLGMVIGDLRVVERYVSKLTRQQIKQAGYADEAYILNVTPDSPAALAGVQKNDRLLALGNGSADKKITARRAVRSIKKRLKSAGQVTLTVQSGDDDPRQIELAGRDICDVNIVLSSADSINAFAAMDNIVMHEGMLRLLDDAGVQFVMAHELAHQAGRHQRKWIQNAILSGGFLYGPALVAGGELIDSARKALGQRPKTSLAGKARARIGLGSEIFEAEADYLGLYMLARAGGDLSGAESTFAFLAREKPASTWIRYTHPLTPERIAAIRLTIKEIEAKRAAGEVLAPKKR